MRLFRWVPWLLASTACTLTPAEAPPASPPPSDPEATSPTWRHSPSTAAPNVGRFPLRRLTRRELDHTLRDVLGASDHPALSLPPDDLLGGYDNQGAALSTNDLWLEAVDAIAADYAARIALRPTAPHLMDLDLYDAHAAPGTPDAEVAYDPTGDGRVLQPGAELALGHLPAFPGAYTLTLDLTAAGPAPVEGARLEVALEGALLFSIPWSVDPVEARPLRIRIDVPATVDNGAGHPIALTGRTGRYGWTLRIRDADGPVRLRSASVFGPEGATLPPDPVRDHVLVCDPFQGDRAAGRACVREILAAMLPGAFRRDVAAGELEAWLVRYDDLLALVDAEPTADPYAQHPPGGTPWPGAHPFALEGVLHAVLMSPELLTLSEPVGAPGQTGPVDAWSLASRLSYGLWEAPPDVVLRSRAADGTLTDPEVLAAEVRRMLEDPRADVLLEDLLGPWLGLRALDEAARAAVEAPEFSPVDPVLLADMRAELVASLSSLVRPTATDGGPAWMPVAGTLTGATRALTGRLATHYGLDPIAGDAPVPFDVAPIGRAGLLGHGGLQVITSVGRRTSPVKRGAWILTNVLCTPPTPPPAMVGSLDATGLAADATVRERLAAHTSSPACAGCHLGMDPWGLAMEHFDAAGQDVRLVGTPDGHPPDATATLPDGRALDGLDDLHAAIVDTARWVPCVAEHAFAFTHHRPATEADRLQIAAATAALDPTTATFEDIAVAVLTMPTFLQRTGPLRAVHAEAP